MTTRRPDPLARPEPMTARIGRAARDERMLTALALVGLVVAGAIIRIWALGGLEFGLGSDDSRYVAVAQNLAHGMLPDGAAQWFGSRAVFLWPVALVFRLAGADDYTAIAWPLACSLLSIVAAFLVGRELAGRRVALVAAGLVAMAPVEVLWATRLRPDAVMPAFVALAVWAALRSRRSTGRAALWWLAGAGLATGAAWSARETALVMIPVVVLAGWPTLRGTWRAGAAYVAGLVTIPLAEVVVFAFDGRPTWPITSTAGAGSFRSPADGWSATTSYVSQMVTQVADPASPLFLALPLVLIAIGVAIARGARAAVVPGAWLAWGFLYLEVGTLVSVDKPARFLTLLTVPAALLIAVALDGRLSPLLIPAVAIASIVVADRRIDREQRGADVALVSSVAGALRDLPPGPVLASDYVWWAKLGAFLPQGRLAVRRDVDPAYLDASARARARLLHPLPDPRDYRGGYVVTGPVHPRRDWPSNWAAAQARIRRQVPWRELQPVARIGGVTIWRWPR